MKVKRIVVSYCLVLLAMMLTEVLLAQSIASTFTLSSGIYPGAPDFTFWNEGLNYYGKNNYGVTLYSGTNASTVINSALSTFDYVDNARHKVSLIGTFEFTGYIIAGNRTTFDLTNARLNRADGYDGFIMRNYWDIYGATYYDNRISILGGQFGGNKEATTSGGMIYFNNMSELFMQNLFLWRGEDYNIKLSHIWRSTIDLITLDSEGDGLFIDSSAQILGNIQSHGNKIGVRIQSVEDSQIKGSVYSSTGTGVSDAGILIIGQCWNTVVDFMVSWGESHGIRLAYTTGVSIRGSSSQNQFNGIRLEGSNYTSVQNYYMRENSLGGVGSYGDVLLTDYAGIGSKYNTISAIADSEDVDWNIEEAGASDYNIIHDSLTFKATGIKMGTWTEGSSHSRIDASYNGTTWVEHWGTG